MASRVLRSGSAAFMGVLRVDDCVPSFAAPVRRSLLGKCAGAFARIGGCEHRRGHEVLAFEQLAAGPVGAVLHHAFAGGDREWTVAGTLLCECTRGIRCRSEARRVGTACVSTFRSRWYVDHSNT